MFATHRVLCRAVTSLKEIFQRESVAKERATQSRPSHNSRATARNGKGEITDSKRRALLGSASMLKELYAHPTSTRQLGTEKENPRTTFAKTSRALLRAGQPAPMPSTSRSSSAKLVTFRNQKFTATFPSSSSGYDRT